MPAACMNQPLFGGPCSHGVVVLISFSEWPLAKMAKLITKSSSAGRLACALPFRINLSLSHWPLDWRIVVLRIYLAFVKY